jgi:L-lactate permease
MDIQWQGVAIGAIVFLIIGIMHAAVIKGEYHLGVKIWPIFLVAGIACAVGSLFIPNVVGSASLAVLGFTLLWGVGEIKKQNERVKKGWFPKNPKRRGK